MLPAKGYAAPATKKPLEPYSFQRRPVGPSDVLIDIKFCGICHSDIHQARDEWGNSIFPMVPGHEITGIVSKVGNKVTKFKIGDHAGVGCFVDSCRKCGDCKGQIEQYCDGLVSTYNGRYPDKSPTYGGYSNFIVVEEDYVLRIPANLPLDGAAPLLCAGITLYSPLRHWGAGPSKHVAILGLGGLGHMGVKLARAMGAEVTVLSQSHKKKDDAMRLGAHNYYAMSDKDSFEKLNSKFDLLLCTVSAEIDWHGYVNMLKVDGTFVAIGVPEKPDLNLRVSPFIWKRRSFSGSMIGSIEETQEMLDFCGRFNIISDIEVVPIQKVNEAFERVVKSDVRYRFVIDMASLK